MKTLIQSSPSENLKSSNTNQSKFSPKEGLLFQNFTKVWQFLSQAIAKSNEIRVWERINRFGNQEWHIYNPNTGRSTHLNSDAEARIWLDQYH